MVKGASAAWSCGISSPSPQKTCRQGRKDLTAETLALGSLTFPWISEEWLQMAQFCAQTHRGLPASWSPLEIFSSRVSGEGLHHLQEEEDATQASLLLDDAFNP